MLSEKRDEPSARAFFEKAIGSNGLPEKVTMDKSGANKAGVNTINLALALLCMLGGIPLQMTVRQIKYLNNIIEQDHRFVKKSPTGWEGLRHFTPLKQPCQELNCIICCGKISTPNQAIQLFLNNFTGLQHKFVQNKSAYRLWILLRQNPICLHRRIYGFPRLHCPQSFRPPDYSGRMSG